MEPDIPLKIEILSNGKDDPYRITSVKEIEFIFHNIAKSDAHIALYYSDENDFILTSLLAVNLSGLWLKQDPLKLDNKRVLESKKLIFVSSHLHVKVQFSASKISSVIYKDQPAYFLTLPLSIHRLQRREYYRLITPISDPLLCVIPDTHPEAEEVIIEEHPHLVTIMDISGGGVGLTCTEQDTLLVPGQTYHNCRIDLRDEGEFYSTIEVKNLALLSMPTGETVRRAGCEFKNLDGASTIMLQRYVTAMQRTKEIL
jgi:c-di-GMP-binding flagellar brake protein YcgR